MQVFPSGVHIYHVYCLRGNTENPTDPGYNLVLVLVGVVYVHRSTVAFRAQERPLDPLELSYREL